MIKIGERNNRTQLVITILFTGGAFVISYLTSFFLAPYITKHIGADAYGFITLARNFAGYAAILTTALNSYAARFISVEYHRNNFRQANLYYSSVFFANLILVGIILFISGILIVNLDALLNIPGEIVFDTKILFVLIFINFAITSVGTAFTSAAYIKNRLDLTGIFKALSYIVEASTILIMFIAFGPKLWFIGLGLSFAAFEIYISNYWMTKKLIPELHIRKGSYSVGAVKTLVINGLWNAINSLGNTLNTGLDLIITNLMLTPLAMGQLSYAKTIGTMFSTLYQLISQPFQPNFLKLYANEDKQGLISELNFSMKVSGFFSSVAFAGFTALGRVYFNLWLPGQDINLIYILTIITIISCLGEGAICPLFYVYTLTTKFKIPCIITFCGGFFNVAGMYFLIRFTDLSVYAVVLTTAIISCVINILFNPLYMAKCLDVPRITFLKPMVRHLISCGVLTFFFILLSKIYMPHTWITLIMTALVYCFIGLATHITIVFNKTERKKTIGLIKKKLMKGKLRIT